MINNIYLVHDIALKLYEYRLTIELVNFLNSEKLMILA